MYISTTVIDLTRTDSLGTKKVTRKTTFSGNIFAVVVVVIFTSSKFLEMLSMERYIMSTVVVCCLYIPEDLLAGNSNLIST